MPINFKEVSYQYGKDSSFEYPALSNINLEIMKNKITAIIGKTGSGKSTLVQHLNALLIPNSGEVTVDQFVIKNDKKRKKKLKLLRKKVGLVFQFPEYQLFEETIYKDIAFGPKNFQVDEKEIDQIVRQTIVQVGLDESYLERSPFELSGGQKRRVAIAGILALNPDILVLDEPTAGLDPKGAEEIMKLIATLKAEGKTIIFVSHDMDKVLKYADQCIVLNEGKLAYQGIPYDLFLDEELMLNAGIQRPLVFDFINRLKERGVKLEWNKVCDLPSMLDLIIEAVHDE